MIDNKVRWNHSKILSYNKLFNFVVGQRGVGKTWDCKNWAIRDFLKNGKKTAWVMRYRTELDEALNNSKFFEDIQTFYPEYMFTCDKSAGYLRQSENESWIQFISFKALSEVSIKAISDPAVNKIIFDEFMPLPGIRHLKNEVERFLEYYFTISRDRDVRAIFLGNNITTVSPYFSYFNCKMPPEGKINAYEEIAIENVKNDGYKNAMQQTRFGKLIQGTNYSAYAIENQSFIDLSTFIMPRPKDCICDVCISTHLGDLFLWAGRGDALFISIKGDKNVIRWAMDEKSHNEKTEYIGFSGTLAHTLIKSHYRRGKLFFDSEEAKARFVSTCSKLIS